MLEHNGFWTSWGSQVGATVSGIRNIALKKATAWQLSTLYEKRIKNIRPQIWNWICFAGANRRCRHHTSRNFLDFCSYIHWQRLLWIITPYIPCPRYDLYKLSVTGQLVPRSPSLCISCTAPSYTAYIWPYMDNLVITVNCSIQTSRFWCAAYMQHATIHRGPE